MNNNMSLLAKCLRSFYPVQYINNESIADIRECSFLETQFCKIEKDCVYIIDGAEFEELKLLDQEANFIVTLPKDITRFNHTQYYEKANIIFIHQFDNIISIYRIVENVIRAFQELEAYSNKLLSSVLNQNTPNRYIDIAAELLGNPILLFDGEMQLISCGGLSKSLNKKELLEKSISVSHLLKKNEIQYLEYPQVFHDANGKQHLVYTVQENGFGQYILEVISEYQGIQEKHFPLLIRISDIMKIWYTRNSKYKNQEYQMYEFFSDIISNKETDDAWILRRASDLGITFAKKNYLIMLSCERIDMTYQELQNMYRCIREKFTHNAFLYEFSIYFIYQSSGANPGFKMEEFLKDYQRDKWIVSISYEFSNAAGLRHAYQQCRFAEIFGYQFNIEGSVRDYQRFMSYHFCTNAMHYFEANKFILPLARQIIEYDRNNKSDYMMTIYQYLNTYKNINATAKLLHIHRNTVIYRIEKAKEIFNLDYDDYALMNNLALSFELIMCNNSLFSMFC